MFLGARTPENVNQILLQPLNIGVDIEVRWPRGGRQPIQPKTIIMRIGKLPKSGFLKSKYVYILFIHLLQETFLPSRANG
jgi:hypothetical protein